MDVGHLHAHGRELGVHADQPPHQQVGLAGQLVPFAGGGAHVVLERGQGGLRPVERQLRLFLRHRCAGEGAFPAFQLAHRAFAVQTQALDAGGGLLVAVARPLQLRPHVLEPQVDDVEARLQAVHVAPGGGHVVLPRAQRLLGGRDLVARLRQVRVALHLGGHLVVGGARHLLVDEAELALPALPRTPEVLRETADDGDQQHDAADGEPLVEGADLVVPLFRLGCLGTNCHLIR